MTERLPRGAAHPVLQRTIGWSDAPPRSPNRAELDEHGAHRYPVSGLPHGNQQADRGTPDHGRAAAAGPSQHESAAGRAIVVVPNSIVSRWTRPDWDPRVEVLVHFHGWNVGYRTRATAHPTSGPVGSVHDRRNDRIAPQLAASGRAMIAILPQGANVNAPNVGLIVERYADEALAMLASDLGLPRAPQRTRLVLTGHSGGGTSAMEAMHRSDRTGAMSAGRAVLLFDGINNDAEAASVDRWVRRHLQHDRGRLDALPDDAARVQYLQNEGVQFVARYSSMGGYDRRHAAVRATIATWFAAARQTALSPAVQAAWRRNYSVEPTAGGPDHDHMVGEQDNLRRTLELLNERTPPAASPSPAPSVHPTRLQRHRSAASSAHGEAAPDGDRAEVRAALARQGRGTPLPDAVRGEMEGRLGAGFGGVRLHHDGVADAAARAVSAEAFTVGQDIYFASGAQSVDDPAGRGLLAHELTHVVQGLSGRIPSSREGHIEVSHPDDSLEQEAAASAIRVSSAPAPAGSHEVAPPSTAGAASSTTDAAPRVHRQPSGSSSTPATPPPPDRLRAGELLIESSVHIGEAHRVEVDDGRCHDRPPTPGRPSGDEITRMPAHVIRRALDARATNPALVRRFDEAAARVAGGDRRRDDGVMRMEANREAPDLVRLIERQFVHDELPRSPSGPHASTLDLLPGSRGEHYRRIPWHDDDFPGGARGPHEHEAERMAGELSRIRPERRLTSGRDPVVDDRERHLPRMREFIESQLRPVPGTSGHRLNRHALEQFERMCAAAAADRGESGEGITLAPAGAPDTAYRTPEQSQRSCAASGNSSAVACFSPHNLGLAIDLRMSHPARRYTETNTRMPNVVAMRESPVHRWMFLHGERFGFYPYQNEPWHWEYNPPGFHDLFMNEYHAWLLGLDRSGARWGSHP